MGRISFGVGNPAVNFWTNNRLLCVIFMKVYPLKETPKLAGGGKKAYRPAAGASKKSSSFSVFWLIE